jgi:hypothetical protein
MGSLFLDLSEETGFCVYDNDVGEDKEADVGFYINYANTSHSQATIITYRTIASISVRSKRL